ncbi:TPA: hypothetical protein ACQTXM_006576 [Pseudomonas aeruginosa]
MKERPILFTGPMVRALLEGRKTATRRIAKPVKHPDLGNIYAPGALVLEREPQHVIDRACPYGQPGDRLWVREAWAADAQVDAIAPSDLSQGEPIWYPADLSVRQTGCSMISKGRVRPSIHMPRWASRILLEITAVRVERLQDISKEQAKAEGVRDVGEGSFDVEDSKHFAADPRESFASLWSSINGESSWDANPWVWVVEFKRVTP